MCKKIAALGFCLLTLAACAPQSSEPEPPAADRNAPLPDPPVQVEIEVRDLAPGAPQSREMLGGQTHAYRFSAQAGDCLELAVDQRGADVRLTLSGPGGEELLSLDGLSGASGTERILRLAETAGDHRLEISSGSAPSVPGRYSLRLEAPRAASPRDRQRVAAAATFYHAETLRRQKGATALAVAEYENAHAQWRDLGDRDWQAMSLYSLGAVHKLAKQRRQALPPLHQTLTLIPDDFGLRAITHAVLGNLYQDLYDLEQSFAHFHAALPLVARVGDLHEEAVAANNLGLTNFILGEAQEALSFYDLALERWRQLANLGAEARTLHNRGKCYFLLGNTRQALADFERALALRRDLDQKRSQASTLTAIGQIYEAQGKLQQALELFEEALPLRQDDLGRAVTLTGIGSVHARLAENGGTASDRELAFSNYAESLRIFRSVSDARKEAAVLRKLGRLYRTSGEPETALRQYDEALRLARGVGESESEANVLVEMAHAERQLGRLGPARWRIKEALEMIEELRRKPASDDLRSSYFATKQSYYDFYVDLLMEQHRLEPAASYDAEALTASERARARALLDTLIEGGADLRRAADPELLEREQQLEQSLHLKEFQRRMLARQGDAEGRRSLERELRGLIQERDVLRGLIRRNHPRYADLTQPRPLSTREIQQHVLDEETLLLEYDLGEERSYLWAVGTETLHTVELPGRAEIEEVARRAYDLVTVSHKRRYATQAGQALAELSDLLLGPVAEQLAAHRRLLIVSDGVLQYLPFAALPEPRSNARETARPPLITEHEIVGMPSASTLAVLRRQLRGRPIAPGTVAVLADPVFHPSDPRLRDEASGNTPGPAATARGAAGLEASEFKPLPFSLQEADAILELVPAERSLRATGFEANKHTVLSGRLAGYRIVHFATHGSLNTEIPDLTSLVLSLVGPDGLPRDGFLRAHEIYNLDLPAELVVMSACQTALGREIKGEGLVGLTQGFMYAGAASVLVSLWNVNDEATAELMRLFYHRLLVGRSSPAAALRSAQADLRRDRRWQAPYYWAGFVLQGEWRGGSNGGLVE